MSGQSVYVNEIIADSDGAFLDEDGDSSDWLELYNPSSNWISLEGYTLSDDLDDPQKWTFPAVSIAPNGYMVIFCSDKNRYSNPLHTNFRLKSAGESILLSNANGQVVDEVSPRPVSEGFSLGKICTDGCYWEYLGEPSPGLDNLSTSLVTFSVPSGVYSDPFSL